MDAVFLKAAGPGFEVVATCVSYFLDGSKPVDPATFQYGWLNDVPAGASVSATITTFDGRRMELCDVDLAPGALTPHVKVGVVLFPIGHIHGTVCIIILGEVETWRQWWRMYRTLPNARLLSSILFNFEDDAQMALATTPYAAFAHSAQTYKWMASKELTGETRRLPADARWRTVLHVVTDVGTDLVCMDVGSGELAAVGVPPTGLTAKGGVLLGMPGAGKFSRVLDYVLGGAAAAASAVSSSGVSSSGVSSSAVSSSGVSSNAVPTPLVHSGLISSATLIVVPDHTSQWRLRQVLAACPEAVVLLSPAHFRATTWQEVLSASVIITTYNIFHAKWYSKVAHCFVANMYDYPIKATEILRALGASAAAARSATLAARKRQRAESAEMGAAIAFFDKPDGGREMRMSAKVRSVAHQLQAATDCGWQHVLTRPVLQVLTYARVVCADVQHCSARQLEAVAQLCAPAKWVTDAGRTERWTECVNRWEVVLPVDLCSIQNYNTKYALLCNMVATVEPRAVAYRILNDTVAQALRDTLRQDDTALRVTAACVSPQYRKLIVFLQPEDLVAAVLVEAERKLLTGLAGDDEAEEAPAEPSHSTASSSSSSSSSRASGCTSSCDDDSDYEDDEYEEEEALTSSTSDDSAMEAAIEAAIAASLEESVREALRAEAAAEARAAAVAAAAVSSTSPHVKEQLALAARVQRTLDEELGKEACKICAFNPCTGVLSCGHPFCGPCVFNWLERDDEPSCPVCMRVFASANAPFFVPLIAQSIPMPAWAPLDQAAAWVTNVCGGVTTAAAFWCQHVLRAAEAESRPLVLMVDSPTAAKLLSDACTRWVVDGQWKCAVYGGGATGRQQAEKQFAAKRQHVIITYEDIVAGCRLAGVTEVVNLCSEERKVELNAVALRLGQEVITIRTCVYSDGTL